MKQIENFLFSDSYRNLIFSFARLDFILETDFKIMAFIL